MILYKFSTHLLLLFNGIDWNYIIHIDERGIKHHIYNCGYYHITDKDIDLHQIVCNYISHKIMKNDINIYIYYHIP